MLRHPDEMEIELAEKLRGGNGIVNNRHLFKKEELLAKARLVAVTTLPSGASIGFHRHEKEEEIYYIISGKGQVVDEDQTKEVYPGCAMLTGNGRGHSIINTGDEPLVFLAVILLFS
ncbi:MAG TPA: cupin [Firmicutes bacterium]|nr:cupin [Bacillota bacterium]